MRDRCTVTIDNSGHTFTCGNEFVLDAAIAQGIALPYNCRGGACGTCKAEILEGAVEHGWVMGFAITDEEIAAGRCLACSSRPTTQRLVLRMLRQAPAESAAPVSTPAEYPCEVLAAHALTPSVRRIVVLLPPEADFRFDSGMYVDVVADDSEEARPYSIATVGRMDGAARGGLLSFLIARHARGAVSSRLHDAVLVGDTLRIRGPYGTFRLPPALREPVLMLAGGTGLAPLLSMAEQLLRSGYAAPIELLFCVRTAEDVFCLDQLHSMARQHANFRFQVFVTRGDRGPVYWRRGRIPEYLARTSSPSDARVFVAGSPGFVEACAAELLRGGLPRESLFTEAYAPRVRA